MASSLRFAIGFVVLLPLLGTGLLGLAPFIHREAQS